MRGGMLRGMNCCGVPCWNKAGCAKNRNPLPSSIAIVASLSEVMLVRGVSVLKHRRVPFA